MRVRKNFRQLMFRLGLAWLTLSAIFGFAAYELELRKIHNFVVALAAEDIRNEIGERGELLDQNTPEQRRELIDRIRELTHHIFIAVDLYDLARNLMLTDFRPGVPVPPEPPIADHPFPTRDQIKFAPFLYEQTLHLRVILPVLDRGGETRGFIEGIFRIDGAAKRQLHQQVEWALVAVATITLITMLVVVPIVRRADLRLENHARDLEHKHRDMMEAHAVSRSKSAFIANLSHEFRTPLNAILGFADLQRNEVFGPHGHAKYREYAEDIFQSAHHLRDLVNDVLDLAKAEAGKLELREERTDLGEIFRACRRLIGPQAKAAGCALTLDLPEHPPLLWADRRKLTQVLINLTSNAVKFTPAGGQVRLGARVEGNGDLTIEVADTGIGIKPEDIPTTLEEFGQTESGRGKPEGTGLGLPIARRLVELHGGTLAIASHPGRGTTLSVRLPAERLRWETARTAR